MKFFCFSCVTIVCISLGAFGQSHEVTSPDKRIRLNITTNSKLKIDIFKNNQAQLTEVSLGLQLKNVKNNLRLKKESRYSESDTIKPPYGQESSIPYAYNGLELDFADKRTLEFRVFDDAIAFRWSTALKKDQIVEQESFKVPFQGNEQFAGMSSTSFHGYEDDYEFTLLDSTANDTLALPFAITKASQRIVFAESNLISYPGLYFKKNSTGIEAVFPQVAADQDTTHFDVIVKSRESYIAKVAGQKSYPWRIILLPDSDIDLLKNRLVYLLADESAINENAWIKPGKVAWDWWNAISLTGVDFEAGVNTASYTYFIDFAAEYGIEYINLDEGWSDQFDLFALKPDVNVEEIIDYAKSKNVGVFLWCVWHTLHRQMPEILDQFEEWGVAGIKVDFMNRDDQEVVEFYHQLAKEAAKREILINFHGAYKPTGLERTYPNVVNREAVMGLEYSKWSDRVGPVHDVTIPYLRNLAGPMDFTPGAMRNAVYEDFRAIFSRPMSQGSRAHQLAMFVIYYAPLQMLADAPTDYEAEPEYSKFMAKIPTVWDETIPIAGKIGEYIIIARRKGSIWYLAGMNNWDERQIAVDLAFLMEDQYTLEGYEDGPNSHLTASDYRAKKVASIGSDKKLDITMKSGGGFVFKLTKQ
ncbi:MAG: glycoside hydrolase family 97 catalytic domain-containing protein [Bacteroidota bacterium]